MLHFGAHVLDEIRQSWWKVLGNGIRYAHTPHVHVHTPVCEYEDVTVLWNQGVHAGKEVTANRPEIIIKTKTRKDAY
jgi:hypothetical protein